MDIFSWRRTLNIKKVIIVIVVCLILISLIGFFLLRKISTSSSPKNTAYYSENSIFYDKNKTISLELSNLYKLTQYTPKQDYLIELRSENNLNIFLSLKQKIEENDFETIVYADRIAFTKKFEKTSNLSEIKELEIDGNKSYTYSFHYLDKNLNNAFYIQIVWIEFNNNYYVFDIEFPLDNIDNYANIVNDTISSFKTIQ